MSMTAVPISIRLVRAPMAASRGNGDASCWAKWWTRKYAPSAPSASTASASSIDWISASEPERTSEYGASDQWPNDRNPIRFTSASQLGTARTISPDSRAGSRSERDPASRHPCAARAAAGVVLRFPPSRARPFPATGIIALMKISFLGGATTVTGSQFLLTTGQATVLIDCGMFQGSPNESIRNRIPFAFDPGDIDAVLLTHAHLDHCGLLPLLVKSGYKGRIHATAGTVELATLVLLDSGKLHEEFAKREARWEKRHPDKVAADDRREADQYQAAVDLATAGDVTLAQDVADAGGEHVATTVEPAAQGWPAAPEAPL